MNKYWNVFINFIIFVFFLLSISLPKVYSNLKLSLLFILFVLALLHILNDSHCKLSNNILMWYMLFIFYHFIWISLGFFNQNNTEALIGTFRLFIIYPLIFLVFTYALSNSNKINILFKVIFLANFLIAMYTIMLFIDAINLMNLDFLYRVTFSIGKGVHEGYTKVGGENITSLFFTFPFVLFSYKNINYKHKKFMIINIFFTIIAIIISGRRMIQLIALFAIIMYLFPKLNVKKKFKYKQLINQVLILSMSGIIFYLAANVLNNYFTFDTLFQRVIAAFEPSSDNVRYVQVVELLKAFSEKPILGVGFGKGITSIVRSTARPWSYEVTYVLTLYQTGLLGFSMFASLLFYNIYLSCKLKKRYPDDNYITPLLYGYIFFLIACFSNPLLGSFDFMWVLYIIPTYYNFLVINKKSIDNKFVLT